MLDKNQLALHYIKRVCSAFGMFIQFFVQGVSARVNSAGYIVSSRLFPGMKEVLDCRNDLDVWRLGLGSRVSGEVVFFACCMSFVLVSVSQRKWRWFCQARNRALNPQPQFRNPKP